MVYGHEQRTLDTSRGRWTRAEDFGHEQRGYIGDLHTYSQQTKHNFFRG